MKHNLLRGKDFRVTFDEKGRANIGGDGVTMVTVTPGWQLRSVAICTGPTWPLMYVATEEAAQDYLSLHPGKMVCEEELVEVRWFLPGALRSGVGGPERGFADLSDAFLYAAAVGTRTPRGITIQPAVGEDLSSPYPYHIEPDGMVGRQDVWKGDPTSLVGFQNDPDVQTVDLLFEDFWTDAQQAVGKFPVFTTKNGDMAVYRTAIESVAVS